MNEKNKTGGKMVKVVVMTVCAALLLGAVTALAAANDGRIIPEAFEPHGNEVEEIGVMNLMVQNIDGVTSYSTDGGATWSEEIPDGIVRNEDGVESYYSVNSGFAGLRDGDFQSLMVREEDGVVRYSTDGGVTWSEDIPENVEIEIAESSIRVTVTVEE